MSIENPRESAIEADNGAYAKQLKIVFRKLNFGDGWPDRILLCKGAVLFIEYKRRGEKASPLQLYIHNLLREQGFRVEVVDDMSKGRELIKEWYDGIGKHLAAVR